MSSSSAVSALQLFFHEIAVLGPLTAAIALSRCHSTLRGQLGIHLRKSFEDLVRKWISQENLANFSTLLRDTLAAISGSTVLHFALRDAHWTPGDFDIYAPFGAGFAIVDWLTRIENYEVVSDGSRSFLFHPHKVVIPRHHFDWLAELPAATERPPFASKPTQSSSYGSSDAQIYRVYKLQRTDPIFSSIDIIESTRPSFLPPITKFHSTLVMNYLTPDKLVVLYPKHTFKREGVLQFRDLSTLEAYDAPDSRRPPPHPPLSADRVDYVQKYKSRGFAFYSRPADLRSPCGLACPARVRVHPDKWALELSFAGAGAVRSAQPSSDEIPAASMYTTSQDSWSLVSASSQLERPPSAPQPIGADVEMGSPTADAQPPFAAQPVSTDVDMGTPDTPRRMPTRPPPKTVLWSLLGPPPVGRMRLGRTLSTCHNPYCPLRGQRRMIPRRE